MEKNFNDVSSFIDPNLLDRRGALYHLSRKRKDSIKAAITSLLVRDLKEINRSSIFEQSFKWCEVHESIDQPYQTICL